MTLHRRILTFYTTTVLVALGVITFWNWFEFQEQREIMRRGGLMAAEKESPLVETLEVVIIGGLPALLIVVVGGHLLMRKVLRPIGALTEDLEKTDVSNLSRPVARTGNGDELDRMAVVFNHMKERLGMSFTQAREFTLHASHELKTPLTIMHGTLEQMLDDGTTSAAHRERISSMLEEVQRLSSIVGQLAFLAKADAGQLETKRGPVAMHELVSELMEDLTRLGAAQEITVTLDTCQPAIVNGDRMRLRQLLLVLGDNAVKHNRPRGSISLALQVDSGHAEFRIINTGTALPPELRSRVFERFFRGDPAHSSAVEGCGLGLSIADTIAKTHQGSLVYDVLADGRTQLTLRLRAESA